MILGRLVNYVRWRLFPSEHDMELRRFYLDGGKELLFSDLDLEKGSLVLDVGGYDGQWASDLYSRYVVRIIILEPVRQQAEKIERRFSRNSDIRVVVGGLGGRPRSEIMWVRGASSSIFRSNVGLCGASDLRGETVQIYDVLDLWKQLSLNEVSLLKLNVEGCEYEILDRLISTELIRMVRTLLVQFHRVDKSSDQRICSIHSRLRETHQLIWQYRYVWERWDRLEAGARGRESSGDAT
jgi:FkbM family methyltransferase